MNPITIVNRSECPVIAILGLNATDILNHFLDLWLPLILITSCSKFQSQSGYKHYTSYSLLKSLCENTSYDLGGDYMTYIVGVLFLTNFYFTISHIIKVI